jgi:acyl-coenzyme A thioesterase PaaI-like protein
VQVTYDGHCFGCGERNSDGLQMRFIPDGDHSACEYQVPARYQSWQGIVHGGMVSLMLDEAVGWAAWHAGHPGVTGRLEVRLRLPLKVGERVRVVGRVERVRRNLIYTSAYIDRISDGVRVADATATLMEAPAEITNHDRLRS